MATKPSIPKGTRDFGPVEMLRRKYIFSTIEKVFQKYGYLPLETPAMENLETLTGKYGEEGDRLIFKILKRGADLERAVQDGSKSLAGEALRYDLTVPFARYVVQNQNEITFPFKRYQIQPVWRADRPQKGRYREFYQCDADVIGSTSPICEVDLVLMMNEVFSKLGLKVVIHVNSRKVLQGLAEMFGVSDRLIEFVTILDKADKIGVAGLSEEYLKAGFSAVVSDKVASFIAEGMSYPVEQRHIWLAELFNQKGILVGHAGMMEVGRIMWGVGNVLKDREDSDQQNEVHFDISLARGLSYYTGAIFEVKAKEGTLMSSICGGGRYDDLTGVFGLKNMSGVGISFGADRIYDVLLELDRFPPTIAIGTRVLVISLSEAEMEYGLRLTQELRDQGVAAELDVALPGKLKRVLGYANAKDIPYVVFLGENERISSSATLKNMVSGEQSTVPRAGLFKLIA